MLIVLAAFRSAKLCSLSLFSGEGFFCSLADEVSFNLRRETESKGQDFALDVFSEAVIVLDSPDLALFGHADVEDFHNHEKTPPQPGKFCADYEVILFDSFEEFAEFPFVIISCAADGFFNPTIDVEFILGAEVVDFEPLVLHCLLVAAYSYISVNHNIKY